MLIPKVSVVIPTYNYGHYVRQAVESVLTQTYPNIEILVIDDGSQDDTCNVLSAYAARGAIKYLFKPNGGTASALNQGIIRSTGKYVCWLSADDLFLPAKVAKQVWQLESNPDLGFGYTSFNFVYERENRQDVICSPYYQDRREMVAKLMEGCFINGSTVIMRKSCLEKVGLFEETLPTGHDYDMWFRFLRYYPCGLIDEQLVMYRWHGANLSLLGTGCDARVKARARNLFPEWLNIADNQINQAGQ